MKKKLLFTALISTVISLMAMQGLSASADTMQTNTVVVHDITPKAKTIYAENSFQFTTVFAPTGDVKSSKLSLEDYLIEHIENFDTDYIDIQKYHVNINDLKNTFGKILCENPDLFYLSEGYRYVSTGDDSDIMYVQFSYKFSKDEYSENKAIIDDAFAPLMDNITDDMSDYEKVLLAHDFLCTSFSYDLNYNNYNLLDFVKNKTGVCQAYYQAYTYILNELGIETHSIQSDTLNHIWNLVKLDGKYYQVDVTWDDFTPDLFGWANHSNFLMDDIASAKQHNTNGTTDWYTYIEDEDYSANDNSFDSYDFKKQTNPFVAFNSNIYYLDNGVLSKYDLSTNTTTHMNDIVSNQKWYNLKSTVNGQYYIPKFSSLNVYKDIIFVNTPNEVLVLNDNLEIVDTLYTHIDTENYLIYGMTLINGNVSIQLESNLNTSRDDFGRQIVSICQVEQYYQKYLQNKDTFTVSTTTPLITTMTTTTTSDITTTSTPPTTMTTPETTTEITTLETTPTDIVTTVTEPIVENTTTVEDNYYQISDLLSLNSYLLGQGDSSLKNSYDFNNDGKSNIIDILYLKSELLQRHD